MWPFAPTTTASTNQDATRKHIYVFACVRIARAQVRAADALRALYIYVYALHVRVQRMTHIWFMVVLLPLMLSSRALVLPLLLMLMLTML